MGVRQTRKSAGPSSGSFHDKRRTSPRGGIALADRARTYPVLASLSFPLAFGRGLRKDSKFFDCRLCHMGSSYISVGGIDAHTWSAPSCI